VQKNFDAEYREVVFDANNRQTAVDDLGTNLQTVHRLLVQASRLQRVPHIWAIRCMLERGYDSYAQTRRDAETVMLYVNGSAVVPFGQHDTFLVAVGCRL
jgi:hypothetical protein